MKVADVYLTKQVMLFPLEVTHFIVAAASRYLSFFYLGGKPKAAKKGTEDRKYEKMACKPVAADPV